MDVAELSGQAELLLRASSDGRGEPDEPAAAATAASVPPLSSEPWVQALLDAPGSQTVFDAHGDSASHHLSTGVSNDHLFKALLAQNLISDLVTVYSGPQRIRSVLRLGAVVCGHPTLVHGGLISALFDETFGVLLYAAGRWGHLDLKMVFTARLEVDYKKPLPAESTVICTAEVESAEGRKIWVVASLTDPSGETTYASSRALFIKPKPQPAPDAEAAAAAAEATAVTAAAS